MGPVEPSRKAILGAAQARQVRRYGEQALLATSTGNWHRPPKAPMLICISRRPWRAPFSHRPLAVAGRRRCCGNWPGSSTSSTNSSAGGPSTGATNASALADASALGYAEAIPPQTSKATTPRPRQRSWHPCLPPEVTADDVYRETHQRSLRPTSDPRTLGCTPSNCCRSVSA